MQSYCILISCGARLAPFDIKELRDLMAYDEMELDMLGDQRTAMFVIISDTDDTFNFVVSILYTQLFNLLCDKADDEHGGRLPYHVRLLLDEFANIGQIPKFDKLIATMNIFTAESLNELLREAEKMVCVTVFMANALSFLCGLCINLTITQDDPFVFLFIIYCNPTNPTVSTRKSTC